MFYHLCTALLILVGVCHLLFADEDYSLYGNELALANNIILTIDDVSIEYNMHLMFNLLQQHNITATIFPNMSYVKKQDPALWQSMVAQGFEIGYHTIHHTAHMTSEELAEDFLEFEQGLREVLNDPTYEIRFVRPPYGVWDTEWMSWANANQLFTVHWNVTTATSDFAYIKSVLRDRQNGGSIILLHTGVNDWEWLQTMLPQLNQLHDNAEITTLSQALID